MTKFDTQRYETARQHLNKGRPAEAVRVCQAALAAAADDHRCWHILALSAMQIGEGKLAADAFDQARRLAPEIAEYHNSHGEFLRVAGDQPAALKAYLAAMQANPNYPEAHANAAIVLRDLGQLDDAEAAGQQALKLKPGHPEAANNLARVLLDRGRIDDAETLLRKAAQKRTDQPDLHDNLGTVLALRGRFADAAKSFRRALALFPGHRKATAHLLHLLPTLGTLGDVATLAAARAAKKRDIGAEAIADLVLVAEADPLAPPAQIVATQAEWLGRLQIIAEVRQSPRRDSPLLGVLMPADPFHPAWPLLRALSQTGQPPVILAGLANDTPTRPLPLETAQDWRGRTEIALIPALVEAKIDQLLDLTGFAGGGARPALLGSRLVPQQISGWVTPLYVKPPHADLRLIDPASCPPGFAPEGLTETPNLWAAEPVATAPGAAAAQRLTFVGPLAGIWALAAALPRLDGLPYQELRVVAPELADPATAELLRSRLSKQYRLNGPALTLVAQAAAGTSGATEPAGLAVLAPGAGPQMLLGALAEGERLVVAAGTHPAMRIAAAAATQAGLAATIAELGSGFAATLAERALTAPLSPETRTQANERLDPVVVAMRVRALLARLWTA